MSRKLKVATWTACGKGETFVSMECATTSSSTGLGLIVDGCEGRRRNEAAEEGQ